MAEAERGAVEASVGNSLAEDGDAAPAERLGKPGPRALTCLKVSGTGAFPPPRLSPRVHDVLHMHTGGGEGEGGGEGGRGGEAVSCCVSSLAKSFAFS